MTKYSWIAATSVLALALSGCGESGSPSLAPTGAIQPCNDGEPSFDVWQADFNFQGTQTLLATVDTLNADTASEFRLVVACDGEVVIDTFRGIGCSFPPPPLTSGTPQCPLGTAALLQFGASGRLQCLAEIGPTQPLDIGIGRCADPDIARYAIAMKLEGAFLALDLVAHNCRAETSCLEEQFGINVD